MSKAGDTRSEKNRRAWELFRLTPTMTRKQINDVLIVEHLDPIATRSYKHLKKLHKEGFKEYLTINKLDQVLKERKKAVEGYNPRDHVIVEESDVVEVVQKAAPQIIAAAAGRAYDTARKMGLSELVAQVFYEEIEKLEITGVQVTL